VTYSEPLVAETIKARFVPVQINTQEEAARSMVECFQQVWTPDLRVASPQGIDLYHWNGYLPPFEFLPQLLVAQAQACLRLQDPGGAAAVFEEVLRRFPTSAVAPEAQYFLAVSLYKQSHKAADLLDNWRRLQTQYPNSLWRFKQSFIEQG
jgi:TolA-binding protein